ncbi:hypothetical protein SAMN05444164_7611 [Bradyrhizobium erythrophlei]|uniref:Uncharacterized protein n=1 Tax=Bradyrhizobium erythrophlei TaxID=1437360 RepID=A0A1H5HRU6_9BRAD|nr:hypothetical protein SAMN05444164_7611 [Bradyrhizobium erythrophlei]
MRRDLLAICGGILATGAIAWTFWGNPVNVPHMHGLQTMAADRDLRSVSQRSPYMRDER